MKNLRTIIIVLVFLVFGYLLIKNYYEDQRNKLKNTVDVTSSMIIDGEIEFISYYRELTIIGFIETKKKFILPASYNYKYSHFRLIEFLSVGDSIHKNAHSDTIYIFKNNKNYYFVLGKDINKQLK